VVELVKAADGVLMRHELNFDRHVAKVASWNAGTFTGTVVHVCVVAILKMAFVHAQRTRVSRVLHKGLENIAKEK